MIYAIGVLFAVSALDVWLLYRVAGYLGVLGRLEERVSGLTHTIGLLTDTTETCFNVVAARLEPGVPRPAKARAARQRRVVGAASSGRSVREIAADEAVAESEVSLRLSLEQRATRWEGLEHGAMRS